MTTAQNPMNMREIDPCLIRVIPERNPRGVISKTDKETTELAESIKKKGLLEPVGVVALEPTEDSPFQYELDYGYRRMLAWNMAGNKNQPIGCVVRKHTKGDAGTLSRLADTWAENAKRVDVSFIDQADTVARLLSGTHYAAEGEEAKKYTKDEVAKAFGLEMAQVNRLARVSSKISADVKDMARKCKASARILVLMSQEVGDGESKEEKGLDQDKKQLAVLEQWYKREEALKAMGRKRSTRSDAGSGTSRAPKGRKPKKNETPEPEGLVSGRRKVVHSTHRTDDDKPYELNEVLVVLKEKQKVLQASKGVQAKEQAILTKGIEMGIRFVRGDLKKLPLNKEDFKVLYEPEVEETDAAAE